MPLEPYKRGPVYWARGQVEYNGRPITGYIRESTRASTEAGARDWINERTDREIKAYVVGEEHVFTFADAVELYHGGKQMAKYLVPILAYLGAEPVRLITAQTIKDLGPKLYPNNSTDSWRRWVIAPARAVINGANERYPHLCPPIRIPGYTKAERVLQDRKRGKRSRVKKTPGSWEWLLQFRQHASQRHAALALLMFTTGARVGQAVAMHPDHLKKLDEDRITIPGAKGHEDREVLLLPEVAEELRRLKPKVPRGWDKRYTRNLRVFGWADSGGPRKGWATACRKAGIPELPPHSAGRHGFGQEMKVRQRVDTKSIEDVGGWSPEGGMVDRVYTHAEESDAKIHEALRTGLVQAQNQLGLKLLSDKD